MDGSNRRVIIRRNIHWPNGLTIDYSAQKIYWTDASLFYIDKANYDGSDRQSILRSAPIQCSLEHPFALALYADKLYWTDWKKRGILSTNKKNGLRCPVIKKSNTSPMDIRAYVAKRQVPRPGKCFALECSFVRNLRKQQICSDATTLVSPLNTSENRAQKFHTDDGSLPILGDPGVVSRAGRKGATKVFKHKLKSPWLPTLTGPIPNGQANTGS